MLFPVNNGVESSYLLILRLKIKLKDIIMSKGVSFFLGVLVGVALTGAAWFAINNSSSFLGRLTMFDERGQMLDADSFFVVSTEDNFHALAIDSEMLFLLSLSQALNINQPIQQRKHSEKYIFQFV